MSVLQCGGVLCEARWSADFLGWVALGVGLNVLRAPLDESVRRTAIALGDASASVSRLGVLEALVPRLLDLERASGELQPVEQARFLAAAWSVPGDDIAGIAPDGALLLRRADGALDRRTDPA
ncbi:MAG: hypothetical protein AABY85_05060 [Gemmatimonadota bacterium]|jgi:biotin-(acetyl-CoA carboxylase) ligase